jgi:putative addiction module killer protein
MEYRLLEYVQDGRSPFAEWFHALDAPSAARIDRYVRRMEHGTFRNVASLGEGVSELKIDIGPGYRVYFGRDGKTLIILSGGGSKRGQSGDIKKAKERWRRYKVRKRKENGK